MNGVKVYDQPWDMWLEIPIGAWNEPLRVVSAFADSVAHLQCPRVALK